MKTLHLDSFEKEINDRILERGCEYYLEGRVTPIQNESEGEDCRFTVEGSERYHVRLSRLGNDIHDYECDCPYDMGPVCKHVAASVYYLRSVSKQKSASKKKTKKNANPYEQQILSAIDYACYRGYIDWRGTKELGETAEDMLEDAESAFEYGNYRQCMDIAIPVMIHMCHALDNADDSNGDIGDPIRMSFDLLMRIACSDDLDSATRNDLMKFCFEAFKNNTFGSYDWHLGMMEIALQLADSRKAADAIIELLNEKCPAVSDHDRDYHKCYLHEHAMSLILSLMKQYYSCEETRAFRNEHLEFKAFREEAIRVAIADGSYDEAKRLALDGIELDSKDKPGLVSLWQNCLLHIAVLQNDTASIIKYAEMLWLEGYPFYQHEDGETVYDYYSLLRETVGEKAWPQYIEAFAHRLRKGSSWFSDSYADLCIKEKWWDKLLDYVAEQHDARYIKAYEKYLKAAYRDRLIELYRDCVYQRLEKGVGRNIYQEICSYLRHMKKLGRKDVVSETIADLRSKYPRRPALLDELDNV